VQGRAGDIGAQAAAHDLQGIVKREPQPGAQLDGSDGRGVGFYFRKVTEIILFGVRVKNARTLAPDRSQVNMIQTRKREQSRKPDEQYDIIEACSPGPYLELFGRGVRQGWATWGYQADEGYAPTWATYAHHSQVDRDNRKLGG